ncbi:hypothetical protein [Halomonas sp. M20]|uniref:hypothetical protein n=1 Tax=Halomonas sp. M20 TaxID=2763264 RepID=UPI001D0AC76A|nr:hypothetical protein [Halomonas sp. M20]
MATTSSNRLKKTSLGTLPFPSTLANDDAFGTPVWWLQQWMETANATTRLQLIWWDMLGNAMHQEAEFFKVMANSTERMAQGAMNQELLRNPAAMAAHYQDVASDVTQAAMNRMSKGSSLSTDFRKRIWEEIC